MTRKSAFVGVLLAGAAMTVAGPVMAQQNGVSRSHRPNGATQACLSAPSADCAISAALETVINEESGLEKAKILVGVARSLLEGGDSERAAATLMLALEEARSVGLSLVTQEKIKSIAPLIARTGDGRMALALAEEIQIQTVRDRVYLDIATENAARGAAEDARSTLALVSSDSRAKWRELVFFARQPSEFGGAAAVAGYRTWVGGLERPEDRYRGLSLLAAAQHRLGDLASRDALLLEGDELFGAILGLNQRAAAAVERLRAFFEAGLDGEIFASAYRQALLHGGRVRSSQALADFVERIGPVEAATGEITEALARAEVFGELAPRARYLASLNVRGSAGAVTQEQGAALRGGYQALMADLGDIESAYERDQIRLALLEGALVNRDDAAARDIVGKLEDDDNQALGLALMAPLLN